VRQSLYLSFHLSCLALANQENEAAFPPAGGKAATDA